MSTKKKNNRRPLREQGAGETIGRAIGQTADEAFSMAKKALSLLNVEAKEVQAPLYTTAATTIDYNGVQNQPLAAISQGVADTQREGDSLKLKRIQGTLAFVRGGADAVISMMITKEPVPYLTSVGQLYENATGFVAPLSQTSWDTRQNFKVLKKITFAVTANEPIKIVPIDLAFDDDVQYLAATTTVTKTRIMFTFISNLVTTNLPYVYGICQTSWIDN